MQKLAKDPHCVESSCGNTDDGNQWRSSWGPNEINLRFGQNSDEVAHNVDSALVRNAGLRPHREVVGLSVAGIVNRDGGSSFFLPLELSFIPRGELFLPVGGGAERILSPTSVPVRVCGTQAPASEMGTGNSASHLRVCRTNLDG